MSANPMRSPDPSLPEDEPLYRSIHTKHWDGVRISPLAVEAPACSFNRSKYAPPESVLVASRPEHTGITEITCKELPPPIPKVGDAGWYEFFGEDDPCPPEDSQNIAHCEIRLRKQAEPYNPKHRPNRKVLYEAQIALAKALRIVKAPA